MARSRCRQLLSRFEWLRGRPTDEPATPPTLIAFDRLYAQGKDFRKRPLRVRRNVLVALHRGPDAGMAQGEGAALPRGRAGMRAERLGLPAGLLQGKEAMPRTDLTHSSRPTTLATPVRPA
jgi:hypothetical protein